MTTQVSDSITVRRVIGASREQVFKAFSNAQAISQWFSPHRDITVDPQHFEFVPEGRYRLIYSMPDGSRPIVRGAFEKIIPPEAIVFTWEWEPPDPHADILTRVSVDLVAKEEATEVVIHHQQLPSPEFCERYALGWEGTLAHLGQCLEEINKHW